LSSGPVNPPTPNPQNPMLIATYLIVSKDGMTPYATATTLREARRLSREARQLGLSGEIVARFQVVSRVH
jgi:hypothetical protein